MERDENSGVIYRKWISPSPRAVLLLVHGLGAYSGRWRFLAEFFLKKGFSSYALDLKGFGSTAGLKGDLGPFNACFRDIRNLCLLIRKENPGKKIFLTGESMGGLIALLMASRDSGFFGGLICISPAFSSRLKFTIWQRLDIVLSLLLNPKKQFEVPFNPGMITHDENCCADLDADTEEHRLATAKLLFDIAVAQRKARALGDMFTIPVLFLIAGEDKLVDPGISREVYEGLPARDKSMIEYPGMYHALSVELDRERVFNDMLAWMEKISRAGI